jgi:hypothetical protein
VIPQSLQDAIADEARAFSQLGSQLGMPIALDPRALLVRDIALQPADRWSPNRHCQMVKTIDGWIAVNLARPDDGAAVPAWLEGESEMDIWDTVETQVRDRLSADLIERAVLLGLPVALVGETAAPLTPIFLETDPTGAQLTDLSVIDLSALWAGPLCGGLLAHAGLTVIRVEDPARPDPTRTKSPDQYHALNGRKRHVCQTLSDSSLLDAICKARVLITSARPHALARLGLVPHILFDRNPDLIWVAITAHGFSGPAAMRVGFGDDCAAAGGLVIWQEGRPRFLGDALADPLTGLRAAHVVLRQVAEGHSGLIDISLAATAADFAVRAGIR